MGTDISGFIECRWDRWLDEDDRQWHAAVDIMHLYNGRSYRAFGALFGMRNDAFRPLAPYRDLPPDASKETRAHFEDWGYGQSWITWAELSAADWDEPALEPNDGIHEHRRNSMGHWELYNDNISLDRFAELSSSTDPHALYEASRGYPEGTEWHDGDVLFRTGRLRRKDAVLENEWEPIWSVMRTLAAIHGDEAVRLVVCFG
ncbi:hypothetical protein [Streptomyces sp. NPDC059072]|uniref:hypothetical protein n=1 Tax=unclassified Streptomyces TaxID=2593676 RepID=UPI0036B561C3